MAFSSKGGEGKGREEEFQGGFARLRLAAWARDLISCGIIISDLTLRFMDRLVL